MIANRTRSLSLAFLPGAFLVAFLCVQPLHAAAGCSNASLTGKYGFVVNGSSSHGAFAALGQIATDGTGNIAGTVTSSDNGTINDGVEVLGNYKIDAHCTGTMTIQPAGLPKMSFTIGVTADGSQISMVRTDNGTTELGTAQAQASHRCSTSGVKGIYTLQGSGAQPGVGPLAIAGEVALRGAGTLKGAATISVDGSIAKGQKISGGFKVIRGCTGAAVIDIGNQGPIHLELVAVSGERGVLFIQIDDNTVLAGSLRQ